MVHRPTISQYDLQVLERKIDYIAKELKISENMVKNHIDAQVLRCLKEVDTLHTTSMRYMGITIIALICVITLMVIMY